MKRKPVLTKSALVSQVAERAQMSKRRTLKAVDSLITTIQEVLAENGRVSLTGFGSFNTTQRAMRVGRNPQTGQKILIPSQTVARFRPAKQLRKTVASKTGQDAGQGKE